MRINKEEFERVLREAVYLHAYNGSNEGVTNKVVKHVVDELFTTQTVECSICGYDYKIEDGFCKDCNK